MNVYLAADSDPDLAEAVVGVEKVEISANGTTWTLLGSPKATGDLLSLSGGSRVALLTGAPADPGLYQFRITWATTNYADPTRLAAYARPAGSSVGAPLAMPATSICYGTVALSSSANASLVIQVDTSWAIQRFLGASATYAFVPHLTALDLATTADIHGTLSTSGTPLSGVEVLAEVVDSVGTPTLLRRALSASDGSYILSGLPTTLGLGSPNVLVVAMPSSSTASFTAKGTGPYLLSAPGSVTGANITFTGSSSPGALGLQVTPQTPAGVVTIAQLLQDVSFGAATQRLIVRSQTMATSASTDDYTFAALPPGFYGVNAFRGDGSTATQTSSASDVLVNSGATSPTTLSFP